MKQNKYLLILLLMFFSGNLVKAQQVQQGYELLEVLKVSEYYRSVPNLSFSVNYTYGDSAYPSSHVEELSGMYKIQDGRFWMSMDSIEYVQGDQFNLTIYYQDSLIAVAERTNNTPVLKLPLLDSLFEAANVDSMKITTLNDSTNSLQIMFKPESYYRGYEMQYDKNHYLIRNVKYYVNDMVDDSTHETASGTALIQMSFSGYSESAISKDYFREDKFIDRLKDDFVARPAYTGFKILVNKE